MNSTFRTPLQVSCPTPDEVESTRYTVLAEKKGYKDLRTLLNEIAPMVARGQVKTLPVCHPALYDQVAKITKDWTFDELHSCASHHRRQCPIALKDLRDMVGNADYDALRYVLLRLATEKPLDTSSRRVLNALSSVNSPPDAVFEDAEAVTNPSDFEPLWFSAKELRSLFGIRCSSDISRASRSLSTTHGHYLIRREIKPDESRDISGVYTYLYRPASFEEKVRDLSENFGLEASQIAQSRDLNLSEILDILNKDDSEIQPLNPFDITQHGGYVNFDAVEDFLANNGDVISEDFSYSVNQPSKDTEAKDTLDTTLLYERVEAILLYARVSDIRVTLKDLSEALDVSLRDLLATLAEIGDDLLRDTLDA